MVPMVLQRAVGLVPPGRQLAHARTWHIAITMAGVFARPRRARPWDNLARV